MGTALRIARTSTLVLVLLAAVVLIWPATLGGATTYVTTYGNSMAPRFDTGDLAVLRAAEEYAVGDVVAYSSAELKTTVMHRIVAREGGRFVLQGDNNDWLDKDQPAPSEVLGKLWFRIPQGGAALAAVSSPWTLAGIGVAASMVLATVRAPRPGRLRGRGRPRPAGRRLPSFRLPRRATAQPAARRVPGVPIRGRASVLSLPVRAGARQMAVMAGCLAVLFVTGASALLLVPETETTSRDVPVRQDGSFSYSGQAAAGTTYPDGQVTTGEPVYTALAHVLTVTYEQELASDGDLRAEGTVRLSLDLTASDGWSTELPGGPAVPLRATPDGAAATATVELNTAVASGLLAAHQSEVGAGGGQARLTVTPVLEVDGTVEGRPLTTAEPAALAFSLEPTALRLEGDATTLSPSAESPVTVEETGPRVFDLRVVTVPLDEARALVLGLALATSLVAVVASWVGSARGAGPAEEFLMQHAGRVLPVARFAPEGDVVDVVDPEALYRVATRLDGLVLHHAGPDGDTFAVRDVGTTYRCVVPRAAAPQTAPAPARVRIGRLRMPRLRGRLA